MTSPGPPARAASSSCPRCASPMSPRISSAASRGGLPPTGRRIWPLAFVGRASPRSVSAARSGAGPKRPSRFATLPTEHRRTEFSVFMADAKKARKRRNSRRREALLGPLLDHERRLTNVEAMGIRAIARAAAPPNHLALAICPIIHARTASC